MKALTRSEKLRIGLVCMIGGIFSMRWVEATGWILVGTFFFIILTWIWRKKGFIFISLFLVGASITGIYLQKQNQESLKILWGKTIEMQGWVESFPDEREKDTRVIVKGQTHNKTGKILLILNPKQKVEYGDSIEVKGMLLKPKNFSGFNYQAYLERFGVSGIIRNPKEINIQRKEKKGIPLFLWGAATRKSFRNNLEKVLPENHQKIAMGILLGIKSELPETIKEAFQRSGLMHILVVSGFNVSVVILVIAYSLRRLGRRAIFLGTLGALIFFLTLTGLDPPVLRAVLMGSLTAWAIGMGRKTDIRNVILLSILLISLYNPLLLQRDIGFFLSIFATLGILFGTPIFEKKFTKIPSGIRTILAVTVSAQIAVSSILILYFEQISTVGVLANLITEPLIPFAMGGAFLVTLLGWLPLFIAKIIAIPAVITIELIIQIALFLGKAPPLTIPSWGGYILLISTLCFFGWKFCEREKKKP